MASTPPRYYIDDEPETPAPTRARISNLQGQVQELVRKAGATDRRHRSEISKLERTVSEQAEQLAATQGKLNDEIRKATALGKEAERCRFEGEGMREELNLFSMVQQQKALLALAEEQIHVVEMERRITQAESARVMRDHKISLFQSREADLYAQLSEKDARVSQLEDELTSANTSLAHQRAAESKAKVLVSSVQTESRDNVVALEKQVAALETTTRSLRESEREARKEIERLLNDERGKEGSKDQETSELRSALRTAKAEAAKRTEELADAIDELATLKELSKERERNLKAKYREANEERLRLAGIEEELESVKAAAAKLKKAEVAEVAPRKQPRAKPVATRDSVTPERTKTKTKEISRKDIIGASDSDDEIPKTKKPEAGSKPLQESDRENKVKKTSSSTKSDLPPSVIETEDEEEGNSAAPEKKKKRKLFGAKPAFSWDPIMNSGDGVIPAFLSPVKPAGKSATVTIPRKGFPSIGSSRPIGRF